MDSGLAVETKAVQLRFSRQAAGRLEVAREWIAARPPLEEAWLVADRKRVADELVRGLAAAGQGRLGLRGTTVLQLAGQLAAQSAGLVPLSRLAAEAVVARTVDRSVADEGALAFFEPVRETPGFLPALLRTLSDLRLAEVDAAELEGVGPRGRDLARLLRAYHRELSALSLADRAGLLTAALEGVPAHWGPMVWLDPTVTSRLEARFVATLVARSPEVLILLPEGDRESRDRLEDALDVAARALEKEDSPMRRLDRGRAYLFERDVPASEAEAADDSLVFFSAPGEGQEAVEIARRLHALAASGVRFDRTAILLRNPTAYQPLVEAALERARIPAYYSRGVLRPDPAGRALLALIDCATEGLSAERFAEYLSFGQVPALETTGQPPSPPVPWFEAGPPDGETTPLVSPAQLTHQLELRFDAGYEQPRQQAVVAGTLVAPAQWEKLLVDAAVVQGEERWRRRLRGLEAEFEKQSLASGEDDEQRARAERSLERTRHLRRFALPLIEELAEWPARTTWEQWLHRLERLAVRSLRRPERVLEVLAELRPMAGVGDVSRDEVRRVLADRLRNLRGGSEGRGYGQVFVAPLEEARGRSFDTVFLPGLAEGVFPRPHFEDPLLLDEDRLRLRPAEADERPDLATREVQSSRERLLAQLAVGSAERRLVASYPTLDALQERARVPSFYALDLLRAADGSLPDQRSLERRAAESSALRQGWPAPRQPEVAIDGAEFDLSVVEPLLRGLEAGADPDSLRGEANYLLSVSDRLARALRQRGRRWRNFFSSADGLVGDRRAESLERPELLELLADRRLTARAYSPTALQGWAACPYRFFLHGVLRLRPRDEAVRLERLDPRTRGSIYHEVQAEALRQLAASDHLPVVEANLEGALVILDQAFDAVVARNEEDLAPALLGVWRSEMEAMRVDLRGWLRHVSMEEEPWLPRWFELGFGLRGREDRDPESTVDPVTLLERFRVRGAIDLVEVHDASGRLRVTDHKTGRPPEAAEVQVGRGEILQPLLYALAAQSILQRPAERGRLFYSTRRGGYETREVPLGPSQLHYLEDVLGSIDEALGDVFLPAAPATGACRYCDFRPVCGPYEETRLQRKRKDRLHRLEQVRTYQ